MRYTKQIENNRLLPSMAMVGCLLLLSALGCNGSINPDEAIAKVNESNIQRLANLYFTYQMKNRWRGPEDEEAFKNFLRSYNPKKLTRIGIDPNAIDEVFVNERDGEPFRIRYGVAGSAMGCSEPVIFEATGVDGMYLVGQLDMQQREMDESEANQLFEKDASKRSSRAKPRNDSRGNR
jgi:hypothetical protein